VDELTGPELDQILTTLKQHYVSPAALSEEALKRATVEGLLDRLGSGAVLLAAPPAASGAPSPLKSETIGGHIAYVRLGALTAGTPAELDKALEALLANPPAACVLDLRATPRGMDYELAAEICRRFCPKGKALFTVKSHDAPQEQVFTSKTDPKYHGMLLALTSAENAGSAEVIAGTLRAQAKAIVIGQTTRGEAAEYAELKLASGKLLRYATAEVQPGGGESIVPGGLKPDLPVDMTPEAMAEVLRLELEQGTAPLLAETSRAHMNEAALVAGRNPEVDAVEASQEARAKTKKPPRDAVLQRAVDLVTSVAVFERRK
jgi:C-terminal processing protease CtpA/Prc